MSSSITSRRVDRLANSCFRSDNPEQQGTDCHIEHVCNVHSGYTTTRYRRTKGGNPTRRTRGGEGHQTHTQGPEFRDYGGYLFWRG